MQQIYNHRFSDIKPLQTLHSKAAVLHGVPSNRPGRIDADLGCSTISAAAAIETTIRPKTGRQHKIRSVPCTDSTEVTMLVTRVWNRDTSSHTSALLDAENIEELCLLTSTFAAWVLDRSQSRLLFGYCCQQFGT
jgi:hypothetical protein